MFAVMLTNRRTAIHFSRHGSFLDDGNVADQKREFGRCDLTGTVSTSLAGRISACGIST